MIVTDTEAMTELAVAGCGIALLGVHHAAARIAAGTLKHVLAKFNARRSDICIYYPARKHLPPRVAAFVEFVVDEVRQSEVLSRHRTRSSAKPCSRAFRAEEVTSASGILCPDRK